MIAALILFFGALLVVAAKWGINTPRDRAVVTRKSVLLAGNLTLSATIVAKSEVLVNATFSGSVNISQPGYVWTIWISNSIIGSETSLPEGLKLVEGTLRTNGSYPVPGNFLDFHAKLQAIKDGEWVIYGRFSATKEPGFYMGYSTNGIKIFVSKGSILGLERQ